MNERRRLRLWAAADGLGAIEFAFVAPFLLALLLGVLDFGLAFWHRMQVANAADAGVQWGMSNTYDATSITNVATGATNLTGISVSPSNPCGCPTTTGINVGYGTPGSCLNCPDSTTAQPYIVVNAQICYSVLFRWPGLTYGGDGCSTSNPSQISLTSTAFVLK